MRFQDSQESDVLHFLSLLKKSTSTGGWFLFCFENKRFFSIFMFCLVMNYKQLTKDQFYHFLEVQPLNSPFIGRKKSDPYHKYLAKFGKWCHAPRPLLQHCTTKQKFATSLESQPLLCKKGRGNMMIHHLDTRGHLQWVCEGRCWFMSRGSWWVYSSVRPSVLLLGLEEEEDEPYSLGPKGLSIL